MAQLEKFIKVTQEQYNTLQNGGTVGSHTGINPNFIYLVENNGSSEGGTVVEANPSDDATSILNKLKVAGVTYSLPSGGEGGEGGSGQEIIMADMSWITGADGDIMTGTIPEEYRDIERLKQAVIVVPTGEGVGQAFRYEFHEDSRYFFVFAAPMDRSWYTTARVVVDINSWNFTCETIYYERPLANPGVNGLEEVLTQLQIGDNLYSIPQGTTAYVENEDTLVLEAGAPGPGGSGTAIYGELQSDEIIVGYDQATVTGSGVDINNIATKEYVDNKIKITIDSSNHTVDITIE